MPAFQYRLIFEDGSSADPPVFTTGTPQWKEGRHVHGPACRTFRILAIDDGSDDFHGVWTIELE